MRAFCCHGHQEFWSKLPQMKDNKQCLSDPPPPAGQWRKLISRIQRPYKMAKLFNQKKFLAWHFFMHMLNISILLMQKYQKPSVKALVQADFPVYAQAKSLFKSKQEKNGSFQNAVILSKNIFLASNYFMRESMCRRSNELFRHKLWYKLNSPHMHYLYTCHTKLLSYTYEPFC